MKAPRRNVSSLGWNWKHSCLFFSYNGPIVFDLQEACIFVCNSRMFRTSQPCLGPGRLSVCPSHCCIVSKRRKLGSRNLHYALPQRLVYCDGILFPWVRGSPRTRASNRGTPLKRRSFAIIGLSSVKTIANRYRHVAYNNKHLSQASSFY